MRSGRRWNTSIATRSTSSTSRAPGSASWPSNWPVRDGLIVSAVSYDDMAGYELEATLVSAPHHDPIVIGRSRTGDHCQVTLERWLPIDGEPGIEDAVNTIRAILAASARPDPARTHRRDDGAVGLPSSAMSAACLGSADRGNPATRAWWPRLGSPTMDEWRLPACG